MPRLGIRRTAIAAAAAALSALVPSAVASAEPAVSIDDVSVTEGTGSGATASFTVSLSEPSLQAVSVNVATASGTAASSSDFSQRSILLSFSPGTTSRSFEVTVVGDASDEFDETYNVGLSNATGATIADATGVGTIVDNDAPPTVSVNDVSIDEPDSEPQYATFTISLSEASGKPVSANVITEYGTAGAGDAGTVNGARKDFAPGQTQRTERVLVRSDVLDEFDETLDMVAYNPVNATIGDGRGTATIVDDDDPPTVSVSDVSINEPDSVNENATFTVSLSAPSAKPISVNLATSYGTASSADAGSIGSLTKQFAPGVTQRTESVAVRSDALDEFDETLSLNATSPTNATISDGTGVATIVDDDDPPTISVSDASINEPDTVTENATFTIALSAPSGKPVSVNLATAYGTASSADAGSIAGLTKTIPAGVTQRTETVAVRSDALDEFDETLDLNATNPTNAPIADGTGTLTIVDDDAQPTVSIEDATVTEPATGQVETRLNVRLSAPSAKPVSVYFGTGNNTAVAGNDYLGRSNVLLNFSPGTTVRRADVAVVADNFREGSEDFVQTLNDPTNTSVADGSATVTIPSNCYDNEGDTFSTAFNLGTVSGDLQEGASWTASPLGSSICASEGNASNGNVGVDWFKVHLNEDDLTITEDLTANVVLDVFDNPGNTDLDLRVYDEDGATEVGYSENTGTDDEYVHYSRPDTEANDGDYFYIAVFGFPAGGPAENDYSLTVTGDVNP